MRAPRHLALRLGCENHESDPELPSGSAAKEGLTDEDAFEVVAVADTEDTFEVVAVADAVVSSEVSVADAAPGG